MVLNLKPYYKPYYNDKPYYMKNNILATLAALALSCGTASAANGRTAYLMVYNTAGGLLAKVELSNKDWYKGPVLDRTAQVLRVNGKTYSLARISKMRFAYGTATGIDAVTDDAAQKAANGVYNMQGVRVADDMTATLPKGIYIVNGRKVIVK